MNRSTTSQYDFSELHSSLLEDMEAPSFLVSGTSEKLLNISSDSSQGILSNEQSVCTGVDNKSFALKTTTVHPSNSIEMPEFESIRAEALKIVSALECIATPKDQSYDESRLHYSEWNISDDFKDESSEKTIPKCHDSKENSWEREAYRLLNEMENYLKGNRSSEGSLILDLNNMDDGLVDTSSTQTTPCDGPTVSVPLRKTPQMSTPKSKTTPTHDLLFRMQRLLWSESDEVANSDVDPIDGRGVRNTSNTKALEVDINSVGLNDDQKNAPSHNGTFCNEGPKNGTFCNEGPKNGTFCNEGPKNGTFCNEGPKNGTFCNEGPKNGTFCNEGPKNGTFCNEGPKNGTFCNEGPKNGTFCNERPKNGTFCNDNDMFSNFVLKQQDDPNENLNSTFNKDDDAKNNTFEVIGNGSFIVEGKSTNLMDMESNALQTVLQCTPVKATPVKLHKSMLFSKSKKKSTGLFRASLMSAKDENSCSPADSSNEMVVAPKLNDEALHAKGTGKEGLLRKIHKSTSISRGPLKAFPLQTQASGDPNARASSTPLEAESKSSTAKDPAIGCSKSCESKIIKFPSFGSVSSIESGNPNNGTVEDPSGGSLGTPEVFRRQDGPARTSTPAMNIKFSKLGLGGSTATLPTPIVAPESKTSKFSRTVSSEATGVAEDKDSHVSEEPKVDVDNVQSAPLKILNSNNAQMPKKIIGEFQNECKSTTQAVTKDKSATSSPKMGSVEKLNPVSNLRPDFPSTEVNNASESQKENIVRLNIAKNSNISDSPIDNLQKENSPEKDLVNRKITSIAPASLPGASLPGTSLPGASLPGASLPGASLPGASLPGASLPGASLPGASLPTEKSQLKIVSDNCQIKKLNSKLKSAAITNVKLKLPSPLKSSAKRVSLTNRKSLLPPKIKLPVTKPISKLPTKPTNIKPQLTMHHPNILKVVENQQATLKNGHKSSNGVRPDLEKGYPNIKRPVIQDKKPKSTIQPVQAIKSNIAKPSLPSVVKNPMIRKPDPKSSFPSKENRPPSSSLPRPSRLRPPSTIPKLV